MTRGVIPRRGEDGAHWVPARNGFAGVRDVAHVGIGEPWFGIGHLQVGGGEEDGLSDGTGRAERESEVERRKCRSGGSGQGCSADESVRREDRVAEGALGQLHGRGVARVELDGMWDPVSRLYEVQRRDAGEREFLGQDLRGIGGDVDHRPRKCRHDAAAVLEARGAEVRLAYELPRDRKWVGAPTVRHEGDGAGRAADALLQNVSAREHGAAPPLGDPVAAPRSARLHEPVPRRVRRARAR